MSRDDGFAYGWKFDLVTGLACGILFMFTANPIYNLGVRLDKFFWEDSSKTVSHLQYDSDSVSSEHRVLVDRLNCNPLIDSTYISNQD